MQCRVCCAKLYNQRSDLCLACSSVATIQQEFIESWGNSRLRNIGADIALSAARSIRALRIYGKAEDPLHPITPKVEEKAEEKRGEGKAPLPRKRQSRSERTTKEEKEVGSQRPEEKRRRGDSRGRRQEAHRETPAQSSTSRRPSPPRGPSEASYSTSSEDLEVKDLTGRGQQADSTRRHEGATPKSAPEAPKEPIEASVPAGSEADKDRSKKAYLEALKHQVVLREGPKQKKTDILPDALLQVRGEEDHALQREEKDHKKQRSDHGRGGRR